MSNDGLRAAVYRTGGWLEKAGLVLAAPVFAGVAARVAFDTFVHRTVWWWLMIIFFLASWACHSIGRPSSAWVEVKVRVYAKTSEAAKKAANGAAAIIRKVMAEDAA